MKLLIIVLFFSDLQFLKSDDTDNEAILCSPAFCSNYLAENTCLPLPDNCNIQNSTHNGIFLPSPDPCNCCKYCLANIYEDGDCAVGSVGGPIPNSICGPGLACDPIVKKCKKMSATVCTTAQAAYDQKRLDGTLGILEVRPECDTNGYFAPYKCVPGQTCFCLDKNGNRVFGEIDFTDSASFILRCICSRKYEEAVQMIGKELHTNEHFRCLDNGDYDSLQCIGDDCFCVDNADGAPTYPYEPSVNINLVSKDTLPCFDEKIHKNGTFYTSCSLKYIETVNEVKEYEKEGYDLVLDYEFPSCSIDGKYSPVQQTSSRLFCADPDGNMIEDFSLDISDPATVGMDCKCARTRFIMGSRVEKPRCLENGNFNPIQCRRGYCYCVDSDGYQNAKEVPRHNVFDLNCGTAPPP